LTAAIGIHWRLGLPLPWSPTTKRIPLIVYGASTAVGSFAIKLARRSNIHPIVAIAGAGAPFVESLIERSEGDAVVDYRHGSEYVVEEIRSALKAAGTKDAFHAIDTVCENGSYQNISKVMMGGGHITLLRPGEDYSDIPASIERTVTYVGIINGDVKTDVWLQDQNRKGLATNGRDFGLVWSRLFTSGLRDGWLKGHPYKVLPGGLNALSEGLSKLKDGKLSASKYVFKIADT
jgi:NADPH2:quinone reductase